MNMNVRDSIRRMWDHCVWADGLLFDALTRSTDAADAWVEYSHILGAEETWLSRLEQRASRAAVWPKLDHAQIAALRDDVVSGYSNYLKALDEPALAQLVAYRNTAGQSFETLRADILIHVMLHGQYHRGKINVLLRQSGGEPAPVDYITFVRGVPAAVTSLSK